MQYRYIAIEGNIGAGKTTLAEMLAQHYDAKLIAEDFDDNNFLPKFYDDPERYAFPLELSFMADRYKQLKNLLVNPDIFQQNIVSDYMLVKSKLFARVNLKDEEYELFQKLFDIIDMHVPPPDLLIYLHSSVGRLKQNIKIRGRSYEQGISSDYLERVQEVYSQYLKREIHRTVIIDMGQTDFVNNTQHFSQLVSFMDKNYDFGTHYLNVE